MIVKHLVNSITASAALLSRATGQNAFDYCALETAENETTFVTKDGSLMSLIELHGVTQVVGLDDFKRMVATLDQKFSNYLGRPGYEIEFFLDRDPEAALQTIAEAQVSARHTARTLKLEVDDLLDEREAYLSKRCAYEKVLISLWTHPHAIHADEWKRSKEERRNRSKDVSIPTAEEAQYLLSSTPALVTNHLSFVQSVLSDLRDINLLADVREVHEAARLMRRSLDHAFTSDEWVPHLPGDPVMPRLNRHLPPDDVSGLLWPPLAWQLVPRAAVQTDVRTVVMGGTAYVPMYVELMPKDVKPFIELFKRSLEADSPWRITMRLSSGGVESLGLRGTVISFLTWASRENKLLADAADELRQQELAGQTNVRLRIAFCTWGPADDAQLVQTRASRLARAVSSWGSCEVRDICGDATFGLFSTVTGLSDEHIGNETIAPLRDALFMAPLVRPTSPWEDGAVPLMTPDGKLMPFQPGSSRQDTWIYLGYAGPGSGKSVLMSAINLALCLSPGLTRLPRIGVIDIGPSSSGLISLLRDALPDDRKHEVLHQRLRMSPECAINVFDTQLGSRRPTSAERAFLVNFLTLVTTPAEEDAPYDMMSSLVGQVIDEAYNMCADEERATLTKLYEPSMSDEVHALVEQLRIPTNDETKWWYIVDELFKRGYPREASLAQRFAVPKLSDLAAACRSPNIMADNKSFITRTNASIIDVLVRMLNDISRTMPILAEATRFDLSNARVVALDIDEVAKKGGAAADRQTAIMYMLARYAIARDFSLVDDTLRELNDDPGYQRHHRDRIQEIRQDLKLLCYDEFHRTSRAKAVREQVLIDMREGRKWNTAIMLASQELADFDQDMVNMATGVFIMSAGSAEAAQRAKNTFGLTEAEYHDLVYRVRGPNNGRGPVFLTILKVKNVRGRASMLLTNNVGPAEMWAFSTTAEDALVRNRLYQTIGSKAARALLARHYPTGSIKAEIERRNRLRARESSAFAGEVDERAVDEIFAELVSANRSA